MLDGGMATLSTLATTETARQEIRKSRFLAVAGPVASEAAAKEFVGRHADPSANHNCWAWRIGQGYRFSDDGEPGLRPDYDANYYGAFVRDPDGHKIEAVTYSAK